MEKTKLKGTYGYKNFISNPEKEYLVFSQLDGLFFI